MQCSVLTTCQPISANRYANRYHLRTSYITLLRSTANPNPIYTISTVSCSVSEKLSFPDFFLPYSFFLYSDRQLQKKSAQRKPRMLGRLEYQPPKVTVLDRWWPGHSTSGFCRQLMQVRRRMECFDSRPIDR